MIFRQHIELRNRVSGGGKSTLVIETLQKALSKILNGASDIPSPHDEIKGLYLIDKIIDIDQSQLEGRLDLIQLLTQVHSHLYETGSQVAQESKARGYLLVDFRSMLRVVDVRHVREMV